MWAKRPARTAFARWPEPVANRSAARHPNAGMREFTPPDVGEKAEIKPEALAILEDGSNFRRLLILSDGMCNGGPMSFRIPK